MHPAVTYKCLASVTCYVLVINDDLSTSMLCFLNRAL